MTTRVLDAVHRNVLAFVLVGALAALLFAVFAPGQFVADSWMTLASGREVVRSGLPDKDTLTVFGEGRRWTDQQWLAQLLAYGTFVVSGLAGVVFVAIVAIVTALGLAVGAARARGGTPLACALVLVPVVAAAPWAWTVRAQVYALPLYVIILWLVVASRSRLSPWALVSLPILVVWANLHGSVTLGALLIALAGLLAMIRRGSDRRERLVGLALVVLAPAAVLATPYGPRAMVDYYVLFFLHPPFQGLLVEWNRTGLAWETVTFWLLALATLALSVRERKRLSLLEALVLAITLVGAVQAIRGIVWFALAVLVIAPNLLSGLLGDRAVLRVRPANLVLAALTAGAVVVAAAALLVRGDEPIERPWPNAVLPTISRALRDPGTLVWGTDRYADWLLWQEPGLRGRLAYDVRFELYTREQIESTIRWKSRIGDDWPQIVDPYRLVLVEGGRRALADVVRETGLRVVYREGGLTVLERVPG